jgi:hypothetical protein
MPIRINLLAEEQAAEEMRRRDPIKRAMYVGALLVVLMLVWIGLTQMNVNAARGELASNETRLKQLEEASKNVRANQFQAADIDTRIKALEKYSTNRFFWGSLLDAIQHAGVENVRLMDIRGQQIYRSGDINKFFTTNITVAYTPPPAWWKFWAGPSTGPTVANLVSNTFKSFTNSAPFTTNILEYKISSAPTGTNLVKKEITSKVDFSNVPWAQEEIVVEIRGRDYGNPPGTAIDEFSKRLSNSPFFKEWLQPGRGLRFTERPPQPRPDPQDPLNPNALFVPFTIELRLKERIFTNE